MVTKINLFILAILLILLFYFSVSTTTAQTPIPSQVPTTTAIPLQNPTVDPTVTALQTLVSSQQLEIQTLRRDLDYEVRDLRWWLQIAGVIAALVGYTSYQAYKSIDDQVRKKIRIMTNKYFYQLDVTNLDVNISQGEHQDKLIELLKSQGLYNISRFKNLNSSCFQGITIFSIENKDDEDKFTQFIQRNFIAVKRINFRKAGFILYAPTGYRIKSDVIDLYPSTALANTPWNLVSTLMVLGRHVTAPPKIEEDEKD